MGKGQDRDYGLTEETRTVINGSFAGIAEEMCCSDKYVYGIRYEDNPDPFAYFVIWYAACVRAGVEYHLYDDRLAQIRAKYRAVKTAPLDANALLMRKFGLDADASRTTLQAIKDGQIDEVERKDIRAALEKIRGWCDQMDNALTELAVTDLKEHAHEAVANRNGK